MDSDSIEAYEKQLAALRSQRVKLDNDLLETDEFEEQVIIRNDLYTLSCAETSLEKKIHSLKESEVKSFMEMIDTAQQKSFMSDHQRQKFYEEAYKDAENRALGILCVPADRIAQFFGIYPEYQEYITSSKGNTTTPLVCSTPKPFHSWTYLNAKIPFSPGIRTPMRTLNGETKAIFFTISKFIYNEGFVKKCKDYYEKYGLEFSFENEKATKGNRWKFILKTLNGKVFFPTK